VRRLRGDLEAAYREAHRRGREPQPGLALRICLEATHTGRVRRAALHAARVEVALAAGAVDIAREACAELCEAASVFGTSGLKAGALESEGRVLLQDGSPLAALQRLREACLQWQRLAVPYETARVHTLLAAPSEALGDHDAAALEREAARQVFERLGALPQLALLATRTGKTP
jgi:hypothetical protein